MTSYGSTWQCYAAGIRLLLLSALNFSRLFYFFEAKDIKICFLASMSFHKAKSVIQGFTSSMRDRKEKRALDEMVGMLKAKKWQRWQEESSSQVDVAPISEVARVAIETTTVDEAMEVAKDTRATPRKVA